MSELPTLTDEQIDDVLVRVHGYLAHDEVDRCSDEWRDMRRAFPAPAPPRPEPLRGSCGDVEAGLTGVRVYVDAGVLHAAEAREVAAKLVECAEWVERYGKAGASASTHTVASPPDSSSNPATTDRPCS